MTVKSGPSIACRHPKVVMLMDNEEDVAGAVSIVTEQTSEFRAIRYDSKSAHYIATTKPSVLLIALTGVERAVKIYGELVEAHYINHVHYSVIMCNNKESSLAFRCCIKGLFDNYFVYQPLYERFRLKMIIHRGLISSATSDNYAGIQEEHLEKIDEELEQLIEQSSQCKLQLLEQISAGREEIKQVSKQIEQKEKNPNISPAELMQTITEGHVKPLLNALESDIKSSLDGIIKQLLEQQTSQKLHAKSAIKATCPSKPNSAELSKDLQKKQAQVKEQPNEQVAENQEVSRKGLLKDLPKKQSSDANGSRILVVEDNQLYRDMLVNVLAKEHYDVDEANDGLKAIKKIKNSEYDLIIMDLFMPNLDGLNATKQIRTVSGGKDIPVIALTGNKNKDIVRKWAAYGLKGYIMKPSTKEEILAAVSRTV